MLTDKKVKAFVITADASASKAFYGDVLGFHFLGEDDYGIDFALNDCLLRISISTVEHAAPQQHTVLGWAVPDIYETALTLKEKGIVFERYAFLQQDESGVWTPPGGTKVAWFKDPNGNVLSIDQKG